MIFTDWPCPSKAINLVLEDKRILLVTNFNANVKNIWELAKVLLGLFLMFLANLGHICSFQIKLRKKAPGMWLQHLGPANATDHLGFHQLCIIEMLLPSWSLNSEPTLSRRHQITSRYYQYYLSFANMIQGASEKMSDRSLRFNSS